MESRQVEAITALLARSRRGFLPLRRALVQSRTEERGAGPLAAFLKREHALDLYLLLHAITSRAPWDVALPARVWARLLGLPETNSSVASISRQWSWLEDQGLVE